MCYRIACCGDLELFAFFKAFIMLFGLACCGNELLTGLHGEKVHAGGGSGCLFGNESAVYIDRFAGVVYKKQIEWLTFVECGNERRCIGIGIYEFLSCGFCFVKGEGNTDALSVFEDINEIMIFGIGRNGLERHDAFSVIKAELCGNVIAERGRLLVFEITCLGAIDLLFIAYEDEFRNIFGIFDL